jgi:hypothetical protein
MEILRKIRNALMHQNGIHNGGDDQKDWRSKKITFTKGKPVDYGGEVWEVYPHRKEFYICLKPLSNK